MLFKCKARFNPELTFDIYFENDMPFHIGVSKKNNARHDK